MVLTQNRPRKKHRLYEENVFTGPTFEYRLHRNSSKCWFPCYGYATVQVRKQRCFRQTRCISLGALAATVSSSLFKSIGARAIFIKFEFRARLGGAVVSRHWRRDWPKSQTSFSALVGVCLWRFCEYFLVLSIIWTSLCFVGYKRWRTTPVSSSICIARGSGESLTTTCLGFLVRFGVLALPATGSSTPRIMLPFSWALLKLIHRLGGWLKPRKVMPCVGPSDGWESQMIASLG